MLLLRFLLLVSVLFILFCCCFCCRHTAVVKIICVLALRVQNRNSFLELGLVYECRKPSQRFVSRSFNLGIGNGQNCRGRDRWGMHDVCVCMFYCLSFFLHSHLTLCIFYFLSFLLSSFLIFFSFFLSSVWVYLSFFLSFSYFLPSLTIGQRCKVTRYTGV